MLLEISGHMWWKAFVMVVVLSYEALNAQQLLYLA